MAKTRDVAPQATGEKVNNKGSKKEVKEAPLSPSDRGSHQGEDHPAVAAVQKRLRKFHKKAESIRANRDKRVQGLELNADQKASLAQEVEVWAIVDELASIRAQLYEQLQACGLQEHASLQVQKRLRKFNKKMEKIEALKDKSGEGGPLNDDQQKVLDSEPEVAAMLAELGALRDQLGSEEEGMHQQHGSAAGA
eukprot:CAMPEP_0195121052 /NCGR_PEP_ID=MMETSP0448-20130528/123345_1 /TAXON_ID=66468 /ORGANISM="Heterocapsa triquestra, Strain CCMP 448" /LENGTH=193 /DNA_ID=CAMNT_0040158515 /DNA_START=133 /DNA_END=714 /DNA_ORIENTATION=-